MIFQFLTKRALFFFQINQQLLFGISWGKAWTRQGWQFSLFLGPFSFTWFLGYQEFLND